MHYTPEINKHNQIHNQAYISSKKIITIQNYYMCPLSQIQSENIKKLLNNSVLTQKHSNMICFCSIVNNIMWLEKISLYQKISVIILYKYIMPKLGMQITAMSLVHHSCKCIIIPVFTNSGLYTKS